MSPHRSRGNEGRFRIDWAIAEPVGRLNISLRADTVREFASMRPVLAGSTSFAVSSTETNVGFWSSMAVTCVLPGGRTRLYSVPTRVLSAILVSTVAVSAS